MRLREKERDKENGEKLTGMNEIGDNRKSVCLCACVLCMLYVYGVRICACMRK